MKGIRSWQVGPHFTVCCSSHSLEIPNINMPWRKNLMVCLCVSLDASIPKAGGSWPIQSKSYGDYYPNIKNINGVHFELSSWFSFHSLSSAFLPPWFYSSHSMGSVMDSYGLPSFQFPKATINLGGLGKWHQDKPRVRQCLQDGRWNGW